MGKLLPLLLGLAGLGAGVGAGIVLLPPPADQAAACAEDGHEAAPEAEGGADAAACAEPAHEAASAGHADPAEGEAFEYIKLDNQFIVPLVRGNEVGALVVVTLSLEVAPGQNEAVYAREPKLQDAFLSVLFDHANAGGFDGSFTASGSLSALRGGLREVARKTVGGNVVNDVLITGMVRQKV